MITLLYIPSPPTTTQTPRDLVKYAADRYGIPVADVYRPDRHYPHTGVRMICMYYMKQAFPTIKIKEIADYFPGKNGLPRHHTTVLHAFGAVKNMRDTKDPEFIRLIVQMEEWVREYGHETSPSDEPSK